MREPSTLSKTLLEVEPSQGRAMTLLQQRENRVSLSETLLEVEPSQDLAILVATVKGGGLINPLPPTAKHSYSASNNSLE